jgi:hypothetical protein
MKLNASRENGDFVLDGGACVEMKLGKDVLGNPVVTRLEIFFPKNTPIPQGGITTKTLRDLNLTEFYSEKLLESNTWEFSKSARNKIQKFASQEMEASGRAGFPIEFYACLAYLYVDQFAKTPLDPTSHLVESLGISKRTLVNRLAMARKLGLLTAQSAEGKSGRAGGTLTTKCELLLVGFFEDK